MVLLDSQLQALLVRILACTYEYVDSVVTSSVAIDLGVSLRELINNDFVNTLAFIVKTPIKCRKLQLSNSNHYHISSASSSVSSEDSEFGHRTRTHTCYHSYHTIHHTNTATVPQQPIASQVLRQQDYVSSLTFLMVGA